MQDGDARAPTFWQRTGTACESRVVLKVFRGSTHRVAGAHGASVGALSPRPSRVRDEGRGRPSAPPAGSDGRNAPAFPCARPPW